MSAFAGLADHLLAPILAQACTATRGGPAAAQVRNVAQLTLVGRRFKALLEKEKPALSLDFSQAPLSAAQLAWLEQGVRNEEVLFWKGPHLAFLKREGQTLTQLRGLPLRLVAASGLPAGPDLTRSPITVLGIQWDSRGHPCARLVAAWLPAGLKRLELHVLGGGPPRWSNKPGHDAPGCLPLLHTIACMSSGHAGLVAGLGRPGAHVALTTPSDASVYFKMFLEDLDMDDSDCNSKVCCFSGRSLHISTGGLEIACGFLADMDDLLAVLFPAGLQEFRVEYTCAQRAYLFVWLDVTSGWITGAPVKAVVRRCMRDRGGVFAFEASGTTLGWRVWPPVGTPAWEAAAMLHDAALEWAAEGVEDIEKYFVADLSFQ